ncbi:Hsp20/alpha crystallin family protein [Ureibacillus sp. FSL K6-8385]|uniref:Hsp20/alpha crystallin family protein n=1 Tax=Ureibacillus terrenus TaxID=118246 RepID=A0A540V410_9BACL|nr:Hsp20/alpha crystallin family protein [Ureibacillus terrenus]MED3660953.1 Hsp20/alpha crystallin family protein [Ureibacillus terrenus]MED3764925.1 Hsp20/alpha crystallin family protein [Ureibacillus terrenus]TQE91448.1 Hsp20/alpha crystallin family protein [Ureibacillus terrenus]
MFELRPFRRKNDDIFEKFRKAFEDVFDDDFLPALGSDFKSLRTDITETKDAYIVQADLPGFNKDDIEIDIDNNYLTIRAKRDDRTEERDENDRIIRKERHFGEFYRSFYIDNVDQDKIEAELDNGVLKITLPKLKPDDDSSSRRIQIK